MKGKAILKYFCDTILVPCLVIDSNIWMNEDYDTLFRVLRKITKASSTQLVLFGPQFDEICNIKRKTMYYDEKNQRARIAINRIEILQKEGLLHIEPITINSDRSAYADPLIIKLLITVAKTSSERICFVSNDKELRIRVREQLRRHAPDRFAIVEIEPLLTQCDKILEAEDFKLIPKRRQSKPRMKIVSLRGSEPNH